MITLNKNTQKAKQFIKNYDRATNNGELWQVYDKTSDNKQRVFVYCKKLQNELNGNDAKIPTKNTFIFTFAFTIDNGKKLVYITPENNYIIEL